MRKLLKNSREFEKNLKELEDAVSDNKRNVGNYPKIGFDPIEQALGVITFVIIFVIMILAGCSAWMLYFL